MNNNLLATIIAFYLSKFNDLALKKLGYKTYKDAFMECGRLIDVKPNYIKLRRDEFDPVYNWRKGWRNRPMAKMVSNIIMLFDDLAEPEMFAIVTDILHHNTLEPKPTKCHNLWFWEPLRYVLPLPFGTFPPFLESADNFL